MVNFSGNSSDAKKEEFTDFHKDLAYAVQRLTEDGMVFLADWLLNKLEANLCIAGGVGLNRVANYQVLDRQSLTMYSFTRTPEIMV